MATKNDLELAHNLRNLTATLSRRLRKQSNQLGLSVAEVNVVREIILRTEVLPSELCAELDISSQFMSQILNSLQQQDFIVRKPSPTDKRKVLISLSKKGLSQIDDLRHKKDEWLASIISKKYSAQQKQIIKQAVELLQNLEDQK